MYIDPTFNDCKLKRYLLNYIIDVQNIRQTSKKKELFKDFFDLLFINKRCIFLLKTDNTFNNIIGKLINGTLYDYLDEVDYNEIYQKFLNFKLKDEIFENGNQITEISI